MRRVVLALISTVAGVVLLLNFKVRAVDPTAGALDVVASGSKRAATAQKTPGRTAKSVKPKATAVAKKKSAAPPATKAKAAPTKTTVTGDATDATYGTVQVQVTFSGDDIVAVEALEAPSGDATSKVKTQTAIPQLESRVLEAQSADVDAVSGATYTSEGYLTSLQSALDKA